MDLRWVFPATLIPLCLDTVRYDCLLRLLELFLIVYLIMTSNASSSTTYTTIEERQIRLLHLAGSDDNEEIVCTLSIVCLDDRPHYEALSYVWGDDTNPMSMQLEGQTKPITPNLHTALRNLRLKDRERILWVDAVCINQEDTGDEKAGKFPGETDIHMHQLTRILSGSADQNDGRDLRESIKCCCLHRTRLRRVRRRGSYHQPHLGKVPAALR